MSSGPANRSELVLPVGYTRESLLACIDREIRHRERAYPRWVDLGKMSRKQMDKELAAMRAERARIVAWLSTEPRKVFDGAACRFFPRRSVGVCP